MFMEFKVFYDEQEEKFVVVGSYLANICFNTPPADLAGKLIGRSTHSDKEVIEMQGLMIDGNTLAQNKADHEEVTRMSEDLCRATSATLYKCPYRVYGCMYLSKSGDLKTTKIHMTKCEFLSDEERAAGMGRTITLSPKQITFAELRVLVRIQNNEDALIHVA